jgi:N-acetylglutamate synthase-like GNAT family acetyltransferase
MEEEDTIIGCAGLITNDFISRMDLWPWICAIYIEESYRGKSLGEKLLSRAKADAEKAGFKQVFLCTDHIGYYEKYGFTELSFRKPPSFRGGRNEMLFLSKEHSFVLNFS